MKKGGELINDNDVAVLAYALLNFSMNESIEHANMGNLCNICYEKEKNCLFYPCKHNFSCLGCGKNLKDCPLCKTPLENIERIYV